ncbi:MAG: Gmad2 immunoglobulin-like domain-containing protein [Rubrobacter sp.]|nr:Gmad2 immunoglobulin-like domain-containing protein [Rubrobacter sp.]
MRRRASLLLVALLALVVFGCGGEEQEADPPEETGTTDTEQAETTVFGTTSEETGSGSETTAGAGDASPEPDAEPAEAPAEEEMDEAGVSADSGEEPPFVDDPEDSGGEGYGADSILAVRFGLHEDYERVVVDLGTGSEPAGTVPEWTLNSPAGDGRMQLDFPSAQSTQVSEGSLGEVGSTLLGDFHVVRAPEGGMFVDIFSERAFYYRVIELPDPARVAVDFRPSGAGLRVPLPESEDNTVLTDPRSGAGIGSPLTVRGYSRNPGASNVVILESPDGETLAEETVTSNDWTATWGYFETSLDFPSFSGEGTLKVGARSARDGTFEGVELPVEEES